MLSPGRLPLSEAEHAAVEKLIAANVQGDVSLTRRDPGESGPVLVHISDDIYLVNDSGRATKQKAAA